jgi:type IV pilus assembly protein PilE
MIELLVVVAVLAILAMAAVPGYRSATLRAQRVEATAALLAVAAAQERFHLAHRTYADQLEPAPPDGLGLPAITANGHYSIEIGSADAASFTATATARGRQAQDTQCASFSVDAAGAKSATSEHCW